MSFVVGLTAKFVVVPSRDGALRLIGFSGTASLTYDFRRSREDSKILDFIRKVE